MAGGGGGCWGVKHTLFLNAPFFSITCLFLLSFSVSICLAQSCSLSVSLSLSFYLSISFFLAPYLSHSCFLTLCLFLSLFFFLSLCLCLSHSLSLSPRSSPACQTESASGWTDGVTTIPTVKVSWSIFTNCIGQFVHEPQL